jgi:dienelactone hydrolase
MSAVARFILPLFVLAEALHGQPGSARCADPAGPRWDMAKLSAAPRTYPAQGIEAEGVRGIFYDGPPYQGRPTRVFAWLGIPRTDSGRKLPGMVLVTGGGGTAEAEWVRLWKGRGYAAIAMSTYGNVPVGQISKWQRHEHAGPSGVDWNPDRDPPTDQWTYHAVSAVILAHSLLRAQPEVDAERIGLTGISWGGYVSCIVAGIDHRFRFVVPMYGCGFYSDTVFGEHLRKLTAAQRDRWLRWWDPSMYLPEAHMPFLWVTGTNDYFYPLDAFQRSYRLPCGPRTLSIRLRMPHGGPGVLEAKEIHVFADSLLKGGEPLTQITGQGRIGRVVWATYRSPRPLARAELNITCDAGPWRDRRWEAVPAQVKAGGRIEAALSENTTVYYLNLFDDRGCVVSTEHEEIQQSSLGRISRPETRRDLTNNRSMEIRR